MERNLTKIYIKDDGLSEINRLISLQEKCEIHLENYIYNEGLLRELYYHFTRYIDSKKGIIWNTEHECYDDLLDYEKEALIKSAQVFKKLKKCLLTDTSYWQNSFQYIYEQWIIFSNYIMVVVL